MKLTMAFKRMLSIMLCALIALSCASVLSVGAQVDEEVYLVGTINGVDVSEYSEEYRFENGTLSLTLTETAYVHLFIASNSSHYYSDLSYVDDIDVYAASFSHWGDHDFLIPEGEWELTINSLYLNDDYFSAELICEKPPCEHNYTDGICDKCFSYEPLVLNDDCYEISNAGQLMRYSALYYLEMDWAQNDAKLTSDITVENWIPVGSQYVEDEDNAFQNKFDGCGHTVTVNSFDYEYTYGAGAYVFGSVGCDGVIENLGVVADVSANENYSGGITGYNNGTIENCNVSGSLYYGNPYHSLGGVAGVNGENGYISNCKNTAEMDAQNIYESSGFGDDSCYFFGGIAGQNYGYITDCVNDGENQIFSGGIAGVNYGDITGCVNKTDVVYEGSGYDGITIIGGIVGYDDGGNIRSCYNEGKIEADAPLVGGIVGDANGNESCIFDCYNTADMNVIESDLVNMAGGIAGASIGCVDRCYNTGDISGEDADIGGIIGQNKGEVTDCYNEGTIKYGAGIVTMNYGYVENCYNTGDVFGINDAGGIAAISTDGGVIENCYNEGDVYAEKIAGGIVGYNRDSQIVDCYNTGKIEGATCLGGIVGVVAKEYGNGSFVANCHNTGVVLSGGVLDEEDNIIFLSGAVAGVLGYDNEISNCYYLDGCAQTITGDTLVGIGAEREYYTDEIYSDCEPVDDAEGFVVSMTDSEYESGKVAYLLGESFGQNIDNDETAQDYPVLGGAKVYLAKDCSGADSYSNFECTTFDHIKSEVDEKEPDCENDGHSAGILCKVCNKIFEGERYPALGHNYVEGICSVCGKMTPVTLNDNGTEYDESDDYYELENEAHLYWFANEVNSGNIFINAKLMNDIAVNEGVMNEETEDAKVWVPIAGTYDAYLDEHGDWQSYGFYSGTFDGNGKTISGLYVKQTEDSNSDGIGLFGWIDVDGVVCNVTVENSYFAGGDLLGGIVGWNDGTVENCENKVDLYGRWNVGGISGQGYGQIIDCKNTGNVYGYGAVGGIAGDFRGIIKGCVNSGDVTLSTIINDNATCFGGIVGWSEVYADMQVYNYPEISDCVNTGNVTGDMDCGGIAGMIAGAKVTNCYNTGDVSGRAVIGGVVGSVYDVHNDDGTHFSNLENCYSVGNVTGSGYYGYYGNNYEQEEVWYVGAVVGDVTYAEYYTFYDCYYLEGSAKTTTGYVQTGLGSRDEYGRCDDPGMYSATAEDFASGKVAYELGADFGQNVDNGSTVDELPVIGGSRVYEVTNCKCETFYSNTSGDRGHDYNKDHVCSVCFELEENYDSGVAGYTLSLGDSLGMNYNMVLDEEVVSDEEAKVIFTVSDGESSYEMEYLLKDVVMPAPYGLRSVPGNLYVVTCKVAAKEITARISCKIISKGVVTEFSEYSVMDYASAILSNPQIYGDAADVVKAMLNYSTQAQKYFGYNTDELANDNEYMTAEDKALPENIDLSAYELTEEGQQPGVEYYGSSLLLEAETSIKHYFIIDESVDVDSLVVTVDGEQTQLVKNGAYYVVVIPDIYAHKLNDMYEVSIGEYSLSYGVFSYGLRALNTDKVNLINVIKALYAYSEAAIEYEG